MELIVFDIQRFALHDGPGIRTTVFLKGCPLDCLWCHNPESKKRKPQLGFLEKSCTGCGRCQKICRNQVHTITDSGIHQLDYQKCIQCGECVSHCLPHALKIYGKTMTTEMILDEVLKDKDFYERSGGGLTVSGGEAMLQFSALKELLKKAKEAGIHVCLDTCGQAPAEHYREIAQYVDLFLYDYKLTDAQEHKKYTGVSNELILKNLDMLCQMGANIYLRCPIIPGINDKESHYRGITEISQKYRSVLQVNLMTYHDMAKGKATQIGETYALSEIKTIPASEKQEIYRQVQALGCEKLAEG
ncbi:MAG: glycyl-radical enzyme activating protein [Eubacteriales bacterium]|nr:glycyl-radical enzyme activating protein [Eubacteriales bacterium]